LRAASSELERKGLLVPVVRTPVCELRGIEQPIVQAPMSAVANGIPPVSMNM
jgi:hypothetical protein